MTERRAGHLTLLLTAVTFAVAAVVTILPYGSVYKTNLLGHQTVCPFAPASTAIAILVAGFLLMAHTLCFKVRS
jgi:hypothetical protein